MASPKLPRGESFLSASLLLLLHFGAPGVWGLSVGRGVPVAERLGLPSTSSHSPPEEEADPAPGDTPSVATFGAVSAQTTNPSYVLTEEVVRPIPRPPGVDACVVPVLTDRNFSLYYDPVNVSYSPPDTANCSGPWQLVVVAMTATVFGRQFDRRFTFILGDVAVLYATTAEPRRPGVNFGVERDVTVLSALLAQPQGGVIELPNPTDSKYTGVFTVSVELQFYPGAPASALPNLVLPAPSPGFSLPRNVYQAKVEIYASHYGIDEFYEFNQPPKFFNSLSPSVRDGLVNDTSFREVVVLLDGRPVGFVFPKPLLYSGAMDPLLWRPFMGIGSLAMPTYTLDLTPFIAAFNDGKQHSLDVRVPRASVTQGKLWYTEGAFLVWTDPKLPRTGAVIKKWKVKKLKYSEDISAYGVLDSVLTTRASREFSATGVVVSSLGIITTVVSSKLRFSNKLVWARQGLALSCDYLATTDTTVRSSNASAVVIYAENQTTAFPFQVGQEVTLFPDLSYTLHIRVNQATKSSLEQLTPLTRASSVLNNVQSASSYGYSNIPRSYLEFTGQAYDYVGSDGCYFRQVGSTINPSASVNGTFAPSITLNYINATCA